MNQKQSPANIIQRPARLDKSEKHLHERWLVLARVGWIVVTATLVILNLIAVPDNYVENFIYTPQMLQDLHRLGLSPILYSILLTVENAPIQLLYLALGLLIFVRRSDDRMALFCSFTLVTYGNALQLYDFNSGTIVPSLATHAFLRFVALVLFVAAEASLVIFFYLFPSGKFAPRWTRWCALVVVAYWLAVVFFPTLPSNAGGPATYAIPLFLLSAVVAQVYRYQRLSTSRERQQTKWVVFGLTLAVLLLVAYIFLGFLLPSSIKNDPVLGNLNPIFQVVSLLFAISIAIAVLRARLWDIDILINRTLVYGLLTAIVIGIYILVVGYLGALFHTNGNLLISLIATGIVAVLFQPLRNLLQRSINRLFYGLRDEPYVVLAGLGQRLKTTLDPDAVFTTIVETVKEALKLSFVAIEVKEGTSFVQTASSGTPPVKETTRLPLLYQGKQVGALIIAPRGRDDALTPADLHLLDDLTQQIGTAVHTVSLTSDLQALTGDLQRSREHLVTAREEERRRLRRDLHDGLGPMLSAIMLNVGLVRNTYRRDPENTDRLLKQLEEEIELVIGDIRRVVYNLRPPALDELGLVGAIREDVTRFGNDEQASIGALKVTVEAPDLLPPLPAAVEVAAYRIVQEAVTNVIRHAHAHSCCVCFQVQDALQIEVSDDGKGIDEVDRIGVGLHSMRERAEEVGGTLTIRKFAPNGTQVTACLPLPDAPGIGTYV